RRRALRQATETNVQSVCLTTLLSVDIKGVVHATTVPPSASLFGRGHRGAMSLPTYGPNTPR
ncbi:MAG TPA: hypothetical protein VG347_10260, partial [Verrucomicrobiae bacterium]|nr:hypothetical protein [Verrucomicrobiae bacterium]